MRLIGNILWFFFTGIATGIAWFFTGLLWCITIIGIPFGKQAFKLARVAIWPFGTKILTNFGKHPLANAIWLIFGGAFLALGYLIIGVLWSITIIGIPFGKQCFKLATLAAAPFGAAIA